MQATELERHFKQLQVQLHSSESKYAELEKQFTDVSDQADFDSARCRQLESEVQCIFAYRATKEVFHE